MANLSGQTIQSTYPGLLNLNTATSGITNSFQSITDGLGNDTGIQIKTNYLAAPNNISFPRYKNTYGGNGTNIAAGQQYSSGMQNIILATPFYDSGFFSYSAATIRVVSATTSSDTLEFGIYTSQLIPDEGLYPDVPIITGLTASTTTTGNKTVVFPSNISMSGYGGGIYFIVWKVSNGGVQPTFRPNGPNTISQLTTFGVLMYGVLRIAADNYFPQLIKGNNNASNIQAFTGQTTFPNPFPTNINTLQSSVTNLNGNILGVLLHTV